MECAWRTIREIEIISEISLNTRIGRMQVGGSTGCIFYLYTECRGI